MNKEKITMNIGVIGIGGVGGYFGGKLTQLLNIPDLDLKIYFVARNQHLREIQRTGLILDTDEGELICKPTYATDRISDLPDLDFCLICVKSYDLDGILIRLGKKVSTNTIILPLLNGVDIYERIRLRISNGAVLPSCVYVGTHIERHGKVTQRGGSCTIIFGKDPEKDTNNSNIFELFEKSGTKYQWLDNPYSEIWSKFIFISAFGLITASTGMTIGEVLLSDELAANIKDIMQEIVNIAGKKGVLLPASIVNDSYVKGSNFPFETKTSFQRDFENKDRPDERDIFGGTIIRLGDELGVPTKTTKYFYNIIQSTKKNP